MLSREKNEIGIISLGDDLLYQIIAGALAQYEGKLWVTAFRGQLPDQLPKHIRIEGNDDVQIKTKDDSVYVRLYTVISFGQSIGGICEDVINSIASGITSCLEMQVDDIEIVVTGVAAKRIAPRRIIYRYRTISGRQDKQ